MTSATQTVVSAVTPDFKDDGNKAPQIPLNGAAKPADIKQDIEPQQTNGTTKPGESNQAPHREPLKLAGALDHFESFEVTPVIGREYPDVNLVDWLHAPNSDELLRDLAITISQRGVVFFRAQDDLTNDLQKELVQRIGELSGKPSTSGLHIHPIVNASRDFGGKDDEISVISSEQNEKVFKSLHREQKQSQRDLWHSDITFEPVPSDYALLRLTELPKGGGDTLWASGYEVYDRISAPYQQFLSTLTATSAQPAFTKAAADQNFSVHEGPRGAPENVGTELSAVHPVIRTNPVTGWRSVFTVGHHIQKINGLSGRESRHLLNTFVDLIVENHDLQVRNRWVSPNDVAIWDNRSVYHAATPDNKGSRTGQRAVSLGERPYFDPKSVSRREALGQQAAKGAAW